MADLKLLFPNYTVAGKLETKIDIFFESIFDKAASVYHKLEENEQLVCKWASGAIATINANLSLVPEVIFQLIQLQFPTLTEAYIKDMLVKAANFVTKATAVATETWQEAVATLQNYLSAYSGNEWAVAAKSVVTALVAIFVPGTSAIQKIEQALEYVYHLLVKPKVVTLVPIATLPTPTESA